MEFSLVLHFSTGPESRGCEPHWAPPEGGDCQISNVATVALTDDVTESGCRADFDVEMMSCLGGEIQLCSELWEFTAAAVAK